MRGGGGNPRNRGPPRGGGLHLSPGPISHQHPVPINPSNGKIPFDIIYFNDIFPKITPEIDDSGLTAALLKRNTEVSPSTEETQAVLNLTTRVQGILENLILSPGTFSACQVDEVRTVGSFKHGTILAGHNTADFVVILKTFPTKEAVEALHVKVADELRMTECVRSSVTPRGFDLSNVTATVRILITTVATNMRKLDPSVHLDIKVLGEHWQAIRHSRWFEENAHNSTVKVLIRILRDMRSRYEPLQPISPWMLDLLAHYATLNSPTRTPLALAAAFRRTLSLMAAGMYLPSYAGASMRGNQLTPEEMDAATAAAQTLSTIVSIGGYEAVLGMQPEKGDLLKFPSVWENGVIVTPQMTVVDQNSTDMLEGDIIEEELE